MRWKRATGTTLANRTPAPRQKRRLAAYTSSANRRPLRTFSSPMIFKRGAAHTAGTSTRGRRLTPRDDKDVLVLEDGPVEVGPGREGLPVILGRPVGHVLVEDDVPDVVLLQ